MLINSESPRIVARQRGGWLALSAVDDDLQIGVEADSEEEAIAKFRVTAERWREILASGRPD
jgi:hypothetical protein